MQTLRRTPPASATVPRAWAARHRLSASRLGLGVGALMVAAILATALGPVRIPLLDVGRLVLAGLPGIEPRPGTPELWAAILWEVRLPRVAVAGLVGASLALAGATYQGVFRNPLADPYLIGVSAGAGLGATVTVVFAPAVTKVSLAALVPLGAFLGALLAVSIAYSVARIGRRAPAATLILAGVAVTSLAASVTTFLMLLDVQRTLGILAWLLGSFNLSSWGRLSWALPYMAPAAVVVLLHGRLLNVLQLEEQEAAHLGLRVERVKLILLGAASLMTAAAVSVSGPIGFVGLLVPHIARLLWGPDYRQLLPLAMLLGAAFLIAADLLSRSLLSPTEVPVGIVTAFTGGPFFLFLLRRRQRGLVL